MSNSFNTRTMLDVNGQQYQIYRLSTLPGAERLPYSLKILLENLLRHEDGKTVTREDIESVLKWEPTAEPSQEIAYRPARVLMQDFTGVPSIVDLAAMRDAIVTMGGKANQINPLQPVELVVDHSVQVDEFGANNSFDLNVELEYSRNRERYTFLKWGQKAFSNFKVVPPATGIVHQINLEYLARVVFTKTEAGLTEAYPDTLVGTDSHTTMINGLGVLGWGVGGIEAEASMLGQPVSMLLPQVVGFELTGKLVEGATATDLVLTVVEMLRTKGVVGKFVEFYGDGLEALPLADRATIANMAPEYGATCGIFPIDNETLNYLRMSGRDAQQIALVEHYARAQGMFHEVGAETAIYSDTLQLNLNQVVPSLAGPYRPQDRVSLDQAKPSYEAAVATLKEKQKLKGSPVTTTMNDQSFTLQDGAIVIAAITSCTNTSNPSVMIGAGLLAHKARERGLTVKPWVKTSLAPGSRVVMDYLKQAGLVEDLAHLGFHLVGYGCTTCIGNSGPLPEVISQAIQTGDLTVCSILSGNRNFEGRVHPEVRMSYLASPPLIVAYALAGRMDIDLYHEPIGEDKAGQPVYFRDIWPSNQEIAETVKQAVQAKQFTQAYAEVFKGEKRWYSLNTPESEVFEWTADSTYIQNPPYFVGMSQTPAPITDIKGARVLAVLGDSVTTDHISPAGSIKADSPAGQYLIEKGVKPADFNSLGSRRGNHEVMMRGTFANVRLRNQMVPGVEGGFTAHQPSGEQMSIYDASMKYQTEEMPLVILAGKEYGSGSSRDWAAKGPRLLGVKAVIVESFERIHRSNLVGMGLLPLQFMAGETVESLGLTGREVFDITGLQAGKAKTVQVTATPPDGSPIQFEAKVRLDTPQEVDYYQHGGILHYVLRQFSA